MGRVHRRARRNLMLEYGDAPVAVQSSSREDAAAVAPLASEEEEPRPAKRPCLKSPGSILEIPAYAAGVREFVREPRSGRMYVKFRPVRDERALPAHDRPESPSAPVGYRPASPVSEERAFPIPAHAPGRYDRSDSPSASMEYRPARPLGDEKAFDVPAHAAGLFGRGRSPSAPPPPAPAASPVSEESARALPAYAVDLYSGDHDEKSAPAPPPAVGRVIEYEPADPASVSDDDAEKAWEAIVSEILETTESSSVPRPYTEGEEKRVVKRLIPVFHRQLQRKLGVPVESLDRFLVLKKVGSGSFGAVSQAIRRKDRKEMALKKMRIGRRDPETLDLLVDEELSKCIRREIELLYKCRNNENVARMDAMVSGAEFEFIMIAMDFYPYTLNDVINSGSHAPDLFELKYMMAGLCSGLAFIHQHEIVHRDLKPANILVGSGGVLKIGDLGLARDNMDTAPMTPQCSTRVYRAPEVLLDHFYEDKKPMDVWSLGVMFCEIADTHHGLPFYGKDHKTQAWSIFRRRGTPTETSWPGIREARADFFAEGEEHAEEDLSYRFERVPKGRSDDMYELFCRLCTLDPRQRITAAAALREFNCLEEDIWAYE